MKKTKLLALILAFLMLISSVGVFAEETQENNGLTAEMLQLRDNIAQLLATVEDGWTAFDMSLYQKLPDAVVTMSDETKQIIIDSCIDTAVSAEATASDLAKSEIILRSLGIDSTALCTSNGENVSNAALLSASDHTASGHYAAPWILLADLQGNLNLTEEQREALIAILQQNSAGGTFGYEWDGVFYPDPDTGAAILAALAPVYATHDGAKALCDEILAVFEGMISENGSFGSANSDAFVIMGLMAMGRNPYEFKNATTGASVVDGLLSYINGTNNGFTYFGADNFMATEQGFRALVSLSMYEGNALNIYDLSAQNVVPGRHSQAPEEEPEPEVPVEPEVPEVNTITVIFSIVPGSTYWIDNVPVTVSEGAKVRDALSAVVEQSESISVIYADAGDIYSISKDGVTLSISDDGKSAMWKCSANGQDVVFDEYILRENDVIWCHYVENKEVSVSGGGYSGGSGVSKPTKPVEPEITEPPEEPINPEVSSGETAKPEEKPVIEFTDTQGHWAKEAVDYVSARGIMNGVDEGVFAPEAKLTRGMLVTMLYRLSGDIADGENDFADVKNDAWYADAAVWAKEKGIASGYGDNIFGADDEVTREQLVVFLARYAEYKGMDIQAERTEFIDDADISQWAKQAVDWAKTAGIVSGRDEGYFDPAGSATRCEIAVVFMRFCEMSR